MSGRARRGRPRNCGVGTVALGEARASWTDPVGSVSDDEGQFSERIGKPGSRRCIGPEIVVASAEVLDEGTSGDDDPSVMVPFQPAHRS